MFTKCPGLYCGRALLLNGSFGACGRCPDGYRSASSYHQPNSQISECILCEDTLNLHDWLYLLFMSLTLLVFEWYIIDYSVKRRNLPLDVMTLHCSATIEVSTASLLALLLYSDPLGNFSLRNCRVNGLSDWYTVFYNPSPGYRETIRCTQEAVYPLYSIVFLFYTLSLALMLLIRPFIARKVTDKNASKTIYLTMYLIPGLVVVHASLGGVIYYGFAYMTIIGSIISIASHFACRLDQRMTALFYNSVQDVRSIVILIGHWLLHAFGLVALTQMKDATVYLPLVFAVPCPTLFYILTSRFTDPSKLMVTN
ncbi:JNK1/MAPK8-associated membrane protein [Halotydeus destructor]|nr:JNK1/MAPK8-associated membrane protein [Halotydeus destructor]